jgi:hypothetical protein
VDPRVNGSASKGQVWITAPCPVTHTAPPHLLAELKHKESGGTWLAAGILQRSWLTVLDGESAAMAALTPVSGEPGDSPGSPDTTYSKRRPSARGGP